MESYFTVGDANRVLADVMRKLERTSARKNQVMRAEAELRACGGSIARYAHLKRQLNKRITELYAAIEELESTGAVLKSIDEGLLDFPSKRFDQEIWLCWKAGEGEIKFWHEADTGFGGRKPLEISNESLV